MNVTAISVKTIMLLGVIEVILLTIIGFWFLGGEKEEPPSTETPQSIQP